MGQGVGGVIEGARDAVGLGTEFRGTRDRFQHRKRTCKKEHIFGTKESVSVRDVLRPEGDLYGGLVLVICV